MKKIVKKAPKVTVCRECGGTGYVGVEFPARCPQCDGSGRVTVSGTIELDIRAFKPKHE